MMEPLAKKPVISERYDSVVFENPSESFAKKLMKQHIIPIPSDKIALHPAADSGAMYDEEEYQQIVVAQKKIRDEIRRVKELCEQMDGEIGHLSKVFEGNQGVEFPFKNAEDKEAIQ